MQAKKWLEAPFGNAADTMDPEDFGYTRNTTTGFLEPTEFTGPSRPVNIPDPCKCKNCSKKTCICRVNTIACSQYCNCFRSKDGC